MTIDQIVAAVSEMSVQDRERLHDRLRDLWCTRCGGPDAHGCYCDYDSGAYGCVCEDDE